MGSRLRNLYISTMPARMAPKNPNKMFFQALTGEDELGVVIRAHVHIEAALTELVEARVPFPDRLPRLNYEKRLQLACALGLKVEHFASLQFLANLRNQFAHRLDAGLTGAAVNKLWSKITPDNQKLVLRALEMTLQKRNESLPAEFAILDPKARFVLISVVLKQLLDKAVQEAKDDNQQGQQP